MAFSICEVVRVACQLLSCFVYAIDKPGDTAFLQMLKAMPESNLCSQGTVMFICYGYAQIQ